jgi:hypothetical protein
MAWCSVKAQGQLSLPFISSMCKGIFSIFDVLSLLTSLIIIEIADTQVIGKGKAFSVL